MLVRLGKDVKGAQVLYAVILQQQEGSSAASMYQKGKAQKRAALPSPPRQIPCKHHAFVAALGQVLGSPSTTPWLYSYEQPCILMVTWVTYASLGFCGPQEASEQYAEQHVGIMGVLYVQCGTAAEGCDLWHAACNASSAHITGWPQHGIHVISQCRHFGLLTCMPNVCSRQAICSVEYLPGWNTS